MRSWIDTFLLLSCLSAGATAAVAAPAEAEETVAREKFLTDVGVILEKGSWIGDVGWSCIKMSLREFYQENPRYKTRLRLHFRDSGDTAFGAASAAMDLLNNNQVQAIIGPQYSKQAKFLMALGSKTHIPVISFSATSPSLHYGETQYFLRTTFSDTIQAEAIAALVQHFNWREVIPIFQDEEYVKETLPFLMDALQASQVYVPCQSKISTFATREQIHQELSRLKGMQTKVFAVHISHSLGIKLFSCAKELGMMDRGYVWIVTYDLMDSSKNDLMQGVLGLEPYFLETKRLSRFKLRWKKEFTKEHPEINATEPGGFGLWAYDTVQALTRAVESSFVENSTWKYEYKTNSSSDPLMEYSPIGPKLLHSIVGTKFNGLSGKFRIIDQQHLSMPELAITNVIGDGKRRVGVLRHNIDAGGNRIRRNKNSITWPGNISIEPKGWEWPTNKHTLRIGIPPRDGFSEFVDMDRDPVTHRPAGNFHGYGIDIFNAAINLLPYKVSYEYIPFEDSKGRMNGSWDDLVYQVHLKNFDAVVGDVTILANRSQYVDFTLPYTESGPVTILVPVKDYNNKSAWAFLEPMTGALWFSIGMFVIFTGIVVWVLEHHALNDQFKGSVVQQIGTTFYFCFSTLVFAHREKLRNNLSRMVVAVWLFAVLILTSSYAASLATMLTVRQMMPTATNMDQLLKDGGKVGYLRNSFMFGLLRRMKFPESNLHALNSPREYNEALSSGTVDAIVDEIPYVKLFLSEFCGKYAIVGPTYKTVHGFGFVFPKGSLLARDVSKAMLGFMETEEFRKMERKVYKKPICEEETKKPSWTSLTLESFWGLFLITGGTSGFAVALHLIFSFRRRRRLPGSGEGSTSLWQKITLMLEYNGGRDLHTIGPSSQGQAMEMMVHGDGYQSSSSLSSRKYQSTKEDGMATPEELEDGTFGREISGRIEGN